MSPSDPPDKPAKPDPADPPLTGPSGPAAGETFGHYLMRERELRGMSLQQISEQTRIGVGNLKALEGDDLSRLPARVFVLGYIRAYAHSIGLNPDEAVLRYEEQSQKNHPQEEEVVRHRSRFGRGLAIVAAVVVLVAVALFLLLRH
jgi:cytoskeletal protein RodZ